MACGSCGSRRLKHLVKFADGTTRKYASEVEAKAAAAKKSGAQYVEVRG